ncbi:uncharacterized protein [Cicer arietinum]|uniref:Uncharacterized protein LOC101514437 n=1 Tax=Cicer arietinum TaxID=3827 RepID=A0A1S2Z330_CICAR|nr:uncharacterized protein LOC101514437 [Cicer arietinum]
MAIDKSIKAQNYFKSLVNKYPSSQAIKACATYYNTSIRSFQNALAELPDDRETASYDARVAGDGPDHCQSYLVVEKKVNISLITTLNNDMQFLSFVAFLSVERLPSK